MKGVMNINPQPGDFGLTNIQGPLGVLVGFGQWLTGDASRFHHAYIVVDSERVIEARPFRTTYMPMSEYQGRSLFSDIVLTDEQRAAVVKNAQELLDTKYNFLDYFALALLRFGWKPKRLRKYIANKGRMICSQLVDESYRRSGIQLFNDGRESMDVTPGDLMYYLLER